MFVTDQPEYLCEDEKRLKEDRERKKYWKQFGPYVQWTSLDLEKAGVNLIKAS